MKMAKGVITDAKVCDIYDLFRRKPRGLGFNDTDVVVVKAKAKDGTEVQENFFTSLRGKGTFSMNAPSRVSAASRAKLARFLAYYKLADQPEKYNIAGNIKRWKNREVEIVREKGKEYIYIP